MKAFKSFRFLGLFSFLFLSSISLGLAGDSSGGRPVEEPPPGRREILPSKERPVYTGSLDLPLKGEDCASRLVQASRASEGSKSHFALGLGTFFGQRDTFSETTFIPATPEVVAYAYLPLGSGLWLRPGFRASYSWQQPEMPSALKINEYDTRFGAEVGLTYNWVVIPSLSLGTGVLWRRTQVEATGPISASQDLISGNSYLPFIQTQLGLGIPIERGLFLLEPYGRYTHVFSDPRFSWAVGFEFTVSVF